jgi:hypothetical protein
VVNREFWCDMLARTRAPGKASGGPGAPESSTHGLKVDIRDGPAPPYRAKLY